MQLTHWLKSFRRAVVRKRQGATRRNAAWGTPMIRVECLEDRTLLAAFVVDSALDAVDANPGDGVADDGSGNVTLRAAIMEANALAGADTITLPAGTYTLSLAGITEDAAATGDLDITEDLVITGDGASVTIIDAETIDRVFQVSANVTVAMSGVTITGGSINDNSDDGGAIFNSGTLTLSNSTVTDNEAVGATAVGGGIYNEGSLTLGNSVVSLNNADSHGGGIYSTGNLSITDSEITDNVAGDEGGVAEGGGLMQIVAPADIMTVEATISGTTISGNSASTVDGPMGVAAGLGGGVSILSNATISDSTISGNSAADIGGGVYLPSAPEADYDNGYAVTIQNSTISGNSATNGGGGVYHYEGRSTLSVLNSTVTNNTGGGISSTILMTQSTQLQNSIVAGNMAIGDDSDVSGPFDSQGNNLIGDIGTATGFVESDLVGGGGDPVIDAHLGALADNGGATFTHALFFFSPAIDAGNNTDAPEFDQRGLDRIVGNTIDIGAVESHDELTLADLIGGVSITATTTPTFSWSELAGADHYDLWVNDLTTGESGIIREMNVVGTSFTPADPLPDGHEFIWTVRAIGAGGETSDFAPHETFSVNVTEERLAAPTITGPAGDVEQDTTPLFEWTAVADADHYVLWVINRTTGESSIREMNVAGTSFDPVDELTIGHQYLWTVRAVTAGGAPGDWATHASFRIIDVIPGTPEIDAPTLSNADSTPTFSWSAAADADRYDLWVNNLTTGEIGIIREQALTDTSFTPMTDLTVGHNYVWTVRAISQSGIPGEWAPYEYFAVWPGTPTDLAPLNEAQVSDTAPLFEWSAVDSADHYDIWVNNVSTGEIGIIREQNVSLAQFQVPGGSELTLGDTYLWTVRAIAESGVAGEWAAHQSFTVVADLDAPVLSAPLGTITETAPTFSWEAVTGADHYDLWVNNSSTGEYQIIRENVVETSFAAETALPAGDSFYWSVRAINANGDGGAWATPRLFTIEMAQQLTTQLDTQPEDATGENDDANAAAAPAHAKAASSESEQNLVAESERFEALDEAWSEWAALLWNESLPSKTA